MSSLILSARSEVDMLEPHAHYAFSTRPAGGPRVRWSDSVEVGGRRRGHSLFGSSGARGHSHGVEHGKLSWGFHAVFFVRQYEHKSRGCRSCLSQLRDLETRQRREHRQHWWSGDRECADRALSAAGSYAFPLSGWSVDLRMSG